MCSQLFNGNDLDEGSCRTTSAVQYQVQPREKVVLISLPRFDQDLTKNLNRRKK